MRRNNQEYGPAYYQHRRSLRVMAAIGGFMMALGAVGISYTERYTAERDLAAITTGVGGAVLAGVGICMAMKDSSEYHENGRNTALVDDPEDCCDEEELWENVVIETDWINEVEKYANGQR